jgi:hypothetical protein
MSSAKTVQRRNPESTPYYRIRARILLCNSVDTLKSFLSPTTNTFKAIFGKKGVQPTTSHQPGLVHEPL